MNNQNLISILTKIAGFSSLVSDTIFTSYITSAFGPNGTKIVAGMGIAAYVAGEILHSFGVQTAVNSAVAQAAVVPAAVVPPITDASHTD